MNCIIVDDEPFAQDLIKTYVDRTPFLSLKAAFTNPFEALSFLMKNKVDLVFLDINMPELSGIQLLESLSVHPLVIFTTAYHEYGAESYEYDAVDYLLKPIKYERFLKALNKAQELMMHYNEQQQSQVVTDTKKDYVFIKSGTQMFKVFVDDILYVEAFGNYMVFHTKNRKILSLLKMNEVLDQLSSNDFLRIHKSFIVSLNYIDIIEKHRVFVNEIAIPLGITYRKAFFEVISEIKER